ncbi:CUN090 putative similar to AcMNPV ORF96 [Culex nigripalpus nucleopolyhedrovirus]|uniref:CUN090 putative similar to AcMNPV ORF96 n=1 Tax=Culex nigripalpus nucleopolyhedrovirus (isolate Florida/1997) TaxID=645993 RepID=Q919I7_NPVCO|nr:CUN090 putative similar to AcMNPV ORF96 [Culex nigripalpus nucleopolyhedrovirus]AAK94168.1 CUN090 putative similar to AcMNPV ORF96 [Culex nigripalpus nucleopolyhedrovirus]
MFEALPLVVLILCVLLIAFALGQTVQTVRGGGIVRHAADTLVQAFRKTFTYGIEVEVYDLDAESSANRMFLVRPENTLIYNNAGNVYVYLTVARGVRCAPNQDVVVQFNRDTIPNSIFGEFRQMCTSLRALDLIEFFRTQQPEPRLRFAVELDGTREYTVIDMVNFLHERGLIEYGEGTDVRLRGRRKDSDQVHRWMTDLGK